MAIIFLEANLPPLLRIYHSGTFFKLTHIKNDIRMVKISQYLSETI